MPELEAARIDVGEQAARHHDAVIIEIAYVILTSAATLLLAVGIAALVAKTVGLHGRGRTILAVIVLALVGIALLARAARLLFGVERKYPARRPE